MTTPRKFRGVDKGGFKGEIIRALTKFLTYSYGGHIGQADPSRE